MGKRLDVPPVHKSRWCGGPEIQEEERSEGGWRAAQVMNPGVLTGYRSGIGWSRINIRHLKLRSSDTCRRNKAMRTLERFQHRECVENVEYWSLKF